MKYFLSFCCIVSPSNRRRGQGIEAGNSLSQECSLGYYPAELGGGEIFFYEASSLKARRRNLKIGPAHQAKTVNVVVHVNGIFKTGLVKAPVLCRAVSSRLSIPVSGSGC